MEEEAKVRMVPPEHSRLPTRRQEVVQEVWSVQEQGKSHMREKERDLL